LLSSKAMKLMGEAAVGGRTELVTCTAHVCCFSRQIIPLFCYYALPPKSSQG